MAGGGKRHLSGVAAFTMLVWAGMPAPGRAATMSTTVNLSAYMGATSKYQADGEWFNTVEDSPVVNQHIVDIRESAANGTASAGTASATGTATSGPAGVGASVSAAATGRNYQITYNHYNPFRGETETYRENLFQSSQAIAQANASFTDQITVSGPVGQVGSFQLTLDFTRSGFRSSEFGGWLAIGRSAVSNLNSSVSYLALELSELPNGGGTNFPQAVGTFNVAAGTNLRLFQQVQVESSFTARPSQVSGSAYANAGNTVKVYLTPLTPGFSFTAESGHSYVIPEPSTALLCGFGLAALMRRRRQACPN